MRQKFAAGIVLILFVAPFLGCKKAPTRPTFQKATGTGGGDGTGGGGPGGGGTGTGGGVTIPDKTFDRILLKEMDCSADPQKGRSSLRQLTREEYQNTLRDVLAITKDHRSSIPAEGSHSGFENDIENTKVTDKHLETYTEIAIDVANEIRPKLRTLADCTEDQKQVCADKLIRKIGPSLWRRPLQDVEIKELTAFYTSALNAPSSDKEAMTALIVRLLTAPNFLYRSELGKEGKLDAYELASALSYFFWGTVPDKELLAAANDGTLNKDAILLKQTERLLADARSTFFLRSFGNGWLGLTGSASVHKNPEIFPDWSSKIAEMMLAEAYATLGRLARSPETRFKDLFLNDYSYGDPLLAKYYSAKSSPEGDLHKILFTDTPRRGVLGLGAILSTQASQNDSNPFRRGEYVLNNFLCYESAPPPPGRPTNIPPVSPNATTRERFAAHSNVPQCKSCHLKIDGIGFGMEDFDGVGLFRKGENAQELDLSGEVVDADGKNTKFTGTSELSNYLSSSRQAKRCLVVKLYRYAHGTTEQARDVCAIRDIASTFETKDLSLSELIIQIITHKAFQVRGE